MVATAFNLREHAIAASHIREYARATSNSQNTKLLVHVHQYTPKDNTTPQKGDITIIGAHANGFPKELYEPLWDDLYLELKKCGIQIRSIIIADAAWQGQSGLLNEKLLGNDPSWLDHARDLMQVLNVLRPPLPIIGLGHSFGASILANVALMHPRIFSTLILMDPVISRYSSGPNPRGPASASAKRRETWPSREEATKSFHRSPFYKSLDPRVLDLWTEHGVRQVPGENAVTLTTTRDQEVFTYIRPSWEAYDEKGQTLLRPDLIPDVDATLNKGGWPTYPVYRPEGPQTLRCLPHLRPTVLYIFGGKSDISTPELQSEKMALTASGIGGSGGARGGHVKKIVNEDCGHLIPFENPKFCAGAAANWIREAFDRWSVQEAEYEKWTRGSIASKQKMSDKLKRVLEKL